MQSPKAQKIDLTSEYPCPCRRRGRLIPIALTEAFGCNRCQQIFTLEEGGYAIEQLSASYAYRRLWRWTGSQWATAHPHLTESYLPIALCAILVLLVIWLPLALSVSLGSNVLLWALVAIALATLPALMLWLSHRR